MDLNFIDTKIERLLHAVAFAEGSLAVVHYELLVSMTGHANDQDCTRTLRAGRGNLALARSPARSTSAIDLRSCRIFKRISVGSHNPSTESVWSKSACAEKECVSASCEERAQYLESLLLQTSSDDRQGGTLGNDEFDLLRTAANKLSNDDQTSSRCCGSCGCVLLLHRLRTSVWHTLLKSFTVAETCRWSRFRYPRARIQISNYHTPI